VAREELACRVDVLLPECVDDLGAVEQAVLLLRA